MPVLADPWRGWCWSPHEADGSTALTRVKNCFETNRLGTTGPGKHLLDMTQRDAATEMGMRPEASAVFDLWLRRQLAKDTGASLAEPLPEEWLRLLSPGQDAASA